mmetsp:Transcript_16268/g.25266  ORF Transcript_16268/g.25266 Transcript_16268/m.25266 type:complete len:335 (-) Transcript_16268:79-1083(-)
MRKVFLELSQGSSKVTRLTWDAKVAISSSKAKAEDLEGRLEAAKELADLLFSVADEDNDDAITFADFARLTVTVCSASSGGSFSQKTLFQVLRDDSSTEEELQAIATRFCEGNIRLSGSDDQKQKLVWDGGLAQTLEAAVPGLLGAEQTTPLRVMSQVAQKLQSGKFKEVQETDEERRRRERREEMERLLGEERGGACFAPQTLVCMADGTSRPISSLAIGDETTGGKVLGVMQFDGKTSAEMYQYPTPAGTVVVAGDHAVLEGDFFVRVSSSNHALSLASSETPVVYDIVTSRHRIEVPGGTVFADFAELPPSKTRDLNETLLTRLNQHPLSA